jgi:hypothetical protein
MLTVFSHLNVSWRFPANASALQLHFAMLLFLSFADFKEKKQEKGDGQYLLFIFADIDGTYSAGVFLLMHARRVRFASCL